MCRYLKKILILSLALSATALLSSCSSNASGSGFVNNTASADSKDITGTDSGSTDLVSNAVDFDHKLDRYKPKKDHYNFYFTYKNIHPGWDAVALGMEDAQRQFLDNGITITYEYMAPETASAEDQKKRFSKPKTGILM